MIKQGKVVIVLGMHRSGTSCLAGTLESHGLFLGNVITNSPFNKKGTRENPILFKLQESIFKMVGCNWYNPPAETVSVSDGITKRYLEIISAFEGIEFWGFKDPRSIFLLDLWLPLLSSYKVYLVASFRHPLAMSSSLEKRNGFSIEQGVELWKKYNQKLLQISESLPVDFFNFNLPNEAYQKRTTVFCEKIGLSGSAPDEGFFDKGLVNNEVDEDDVTLKYVWGEQYFRLLQKGKESIKGLSIDG
ncbi:MAG: hypothetical protein GY816_14560 [Cytophagales bacterium]|nr:hypothetical protein [Cytophagales bacterium]